VAIQDNTKFHRILQHEAGSKVSYLQLPVSMNLCESKMQTHASKNENSNIPLVSSNKGPGSITYLYLAAMSALAPSLH